MLSAIMPAFEIADNHASKLARMMDVSPEEVLFYKIERI